MTSTLVPTIPDNGLTEVYSTPDPLVDIVFVHGLNGHPAKTWTAANGVFWPRDLLPAHLPGQRFRVLTYGYDARVSAFTDGVGKDNIHHHSENLVARLYTNRSVSSRCTADHAHGLTLCQSNKANERPIIFVVHSLGGLVTKQALIYSRSIDHPNSEHLRSIYVSTYGILFLGTPHLGSDLAKWGSLLQSIASAVLPRKLFDSSGHLVEALKSNNETLQNINRHFNEILPKLRIFCFYEGKPMDLKGTRQFVVDEASAAPNWPGVERMGIEKDHSTMCKFENANETGFDVIAEALTRYSAESWPVIAGRWEEENQVRAFQKQMAARELLPGPARTSRGSSPDTRNPSRSAQTPNLSGAQTPKLLENNAATVTPWEIEEHEVEGSKILGSARPAPLALHDSTNISSPRSPAATPMTSSIPRLVHPGLLVAPLGFRPNTHFVGFDIEMARLGAKLADERRSRIGVRSALLYGSPGSGKSHLAREYLWRHYEEYPNGIFWIDCKTTESRTKGFWNVAQALHCADEAPGPRRDAFVDAVRSHLARLDKWLMVFDGISFDNEAELADFVRYIPDGKGSSIIYTTVDKTLSNRQRLLDPAGIKVYPLSIDQACTLLFKSLNMKEGRLPTSQQLKKAKQLVKYYDCLPLGIHAAAHMLLARGRPLEKYVPGPSDNRLAAPFLDILASLQRSQLHEAVNLLRIICFLNHEVPVGLLQFGHSSLVESGVEIRSIDTNGGSGRRDLDNSIAVLIKYGLVERRLQTQSSSSSSGGRSSPEEARSQTQGQRQASVAVSEHEDPDGDSQKSSATFIGIDVIRVHTVVQQVFVDYLRANSQHHFNTWLAVTARFLIASWTFAHTRIRSNAGKALVSDYREFESHAEKVWSHFPTRPEGVSQSLRQARHDLHAVRRIIRREIDNHSPSQSSMSSGRATFASIFERSGSSSDEGPATPTSGITRMSTWTLGSNADSTESPVEYQQSTFPNLPRSLESSWHDDDNGYLSDNETRSSLAKQRRTSTSTERALDERQAALRAIFEGRNRTESGSWKPIPVVGTSVADIEPIHSRSNSFTSQVSVRLNSTPSLAAAALSTLHNRSPPPSKGVDGTSRRDGSSRQPLSELPSNVPMTSSSSDPRLSRYTSSTSPHLVQAVLASTARRDQLPIEQNISITRRSQPMIIGGRSWKPSLPTLESHSLPAEYAPIAMARDLSHESTTSVQTEPADNNANSISDEYLTPLMSPVEQRTQKETENERGRVRPPSITTASGPAQGSLPPYPIPSSPDTEPMPIINPSGLGLTLQQPPKSEETRIPR